MTAGEISNRVLARLDDDVAHPLSVTPGEIMRAVNEGQETASWLTLCFETESDLILPAFASFVNIRSSHPDYIAPLRIEINGLRLRPSTLADLDALDEGWQAAQGTPYRYVTLGFNLLAVNQQGTVDTTARFTYARSPAPLTSVDDFPELPEAYHQCLVDYGIYRVRVKEGAQGLARGVKYLARYLDAMTALGDYVRAKSRAARYDTLPIELQLFDRSRLMGTPEKSGKSKHEKAA